MGKETPSTRERREALTYLKLQHHPHPRCSAVRGPGSPRQTSAVSERAEQTRALYRMLSSTGILRRVSWVGVVRPLALALTLGKGRGMMSAVPMAGRAQGYGYEISGTGPRWSTRGQRWGLGSPHVVGAGLRRHSR